MCGAWPDLVSAMRHALTGKEGGAGSDPKTSRWANLPGLCCQAAGGEAEWADDVTLAWLLFYAAADLMDSVQDQDEPDEWWREQGPGAALAAASGLYFSASFVLDRLNRKEETSTAAPGVISDFYQAFLLMTSGQYQDLTTAVSTIEVYWRLSESKSGAFFRLACQAGARLARADQEILQAYGAYGLHLGLLIQVMDDLDDIRQLHSLLPTWQKANIKRSLPFVYALEMNPAPIQERLMACLDNADQNQPAVDELVTLLDECNASLYVMAEMEHQRQSALAGLERARPRSPYRDTLVALVRDL
jgi:geranylgeranyl pyrophosphate synthase